MSAIRADGSRSLGQLQKLRAENERLRLRLALLSRLSSQITSSLEPATVFQDVVDAACELTRACYGALGVFDDSGRITQFITHGLTPAERKGIGSVPKGLGILGHLQKLREPLRLSDLRRHGSSKGFPPHHPPMKSFLGVPIRHEGEALGNLYLTEKVGGQEFTEEDEQVLVLFAAQAAMAIRNARLHEGVQDHLSDLEHGSRELELLRGLSRLATCGPELEEVVAGTLPLVVQASQADAAEVWLLDSSRQTLRRIAQEPGTEAFFARDSFRLGEGLPGLAAQKLKPVSSGDLRKDARPLRSSVVEAGFRALWAFPLVFQGGPLGALCVTFRDTKRGGERERAILQAMADELGLAIGKAQLCQALAESEARLRTLLETSPVGVFVADADGQILFANREAQRIVGFAHQPEYRLGRYERAAVYRRPDGKPYAIDDLPLQRALYHGERAVAEEVRFDFADGRTISTLVDAAPIYSPDSKISGAVAIIQDITPLEEVERLRSEFLGLVSHELKTPLTAIKGAAAAVLGASRAPDAGEALELFQIINEQADRLRELVDNLLDVTRIEAGSLSVNPEPVELGPILDEARQTLRRAGYRQEVRFELADGLPALNADRRRLVQVLVNLLTNAAKSSPEQAPITVSAEARETDVIVRVKDLGRGIAKDQLPRLFEKFARLHGERDAGTGLGLTIARGIVRAHGGRIWADSAGEGKGAAFSFTLPLAPQPATAAAASPSSPGIVRTGDRRRILVVDDDPRVVRLLRRALDEAGYEAMEPKGWDDIVSSVELEQPDLIVLDLMLPGASGFDVLQRVRELSSVPVIFLTASDDTADIVRALRLGADDYITKPFAPSEVIARTEAILRREGTHRGSLRPPFALGGLNVNFAERRVTVDGKPVKLTATEYKLLHELAANAGQVLTHDQILDRVWGAHFAGASDLVRAFVRNLRRKLGDDARRPRYVLTERQVGYRMPKP